MNPSVLWPNSPQAIQKRLPAGQLGANMAPIQRSIISSYPASESGRGWLEAGQGRNVDLLA